MAVSNTFLNLLGFESRSMWLMSPSERLAVIGMIEVMRPQSCLELGHSRGGCTEWLAKYSASVYSVDHSSWVIESCKRWPNVRSFHMKTSEALNSFAAADFRFDFAIIDAGHSRDDTKADLEKTLRLADVIVLHDTFNPECRAGYVAALQGTGAFADLDLLPGGHQADGAWGGLGVVLPLLSLHSVRSITPRQY